ncbi:hypothetical protein [Fibrella forsythiae]|uniref:Uncharacterized protein n=1 Tax=Fibrella forsythiae TaxID=2817061 RepID=A0ABS3JBC5_9BACT|nr:hypothetical protein [Fibrella forsythiae]MBO0947285.1 hypothetical protein [Fibrella forsythiae]
MVIQYPYELWKLVIGQRLQNAEGDWLPAVETWVKHGMCRDEQNGRGQVVILEDGKAYVFNTLIQLPKRTGKLLSGTSVQVRMPDGEVRAEGEIMQFRPSQLHAQAWL